MERGRGSAERKLTAMNDWHYGCLFSIRAFFFFLFSSFSTSFVFYYFISLRRLRPTCFFHSLFYFERSYLARIVESHILHFSLLPLSFQEISLVLHIPRLLCRVFFRSLGYLTRDNGWTTILSCRRASTKLVSCGITRLIYLLLD